jgi:gluconate 2-dehydrogenase gamma chain
MARIRHKSRVKEKPPERTKPLSRRGFLKGIAMGAGVAALAGGAGTIGVRLLAGHTYRPRFLSMQQFDTLRAACERILPADGEPGAHVTGAAIYVDRLLAEDSYTGDFMRYRSILTKGLDGLEVAAKTEHGKGFAQLANRDQDGLLGGRTDPEFLATLVNVTLDGTFYDPFYGGNRDGLGWQIVGFSPTTSFQSKGLTLTHGAVGR